MKRITGILLGWMFISILVAAPAMAHKVNIFAYYEDGQVFTESYFPDGKKVVDGIVEVCDAQKHRLLSGKTDKAGLFSFPFTKREDITITIRATMGHKNQFILKKEDME